MHPYATDTPKRAHVNAALILLSIVIAILIDRIIVSRSIEVGEYGWLLSPPTVFGVYGVLWWLFDTRVWRFIGQRFPGLLDVPDLSGEWAGMLRSSYDNFANEIPVRVEIRQSWSNISIRFRTEFSSSRSLTASINTHASEAYLLSYSFLNEPKGSALGSIQMHRGTAYFDLVNNRLEGQYYTGGGRKNHGEVCLERKPQRSNALSVK